ncbi:MAG: hypothetical protein GY810_27960 [Aureispira sp.]|jgi:hypothetical protein|nr:hypothetical protein [Aureispira sp.]
MKSKTLLILTVASACVLYQYIPATSQVVGDDSETSKVSEVFSSIGSKEDKLTIYKLFAGSAEYLQNCKSLQATQQFDPILGRVQSSYGWDREKYPEFTDAVSEYLVSVGYDEPKPLTTEEQRKNFSNVFQSLAEATKYE